jgi:formate hydrogenlyase subunit 3/multisubunit Na+/H+ antiporter MnhD subunit
MEIMAKKHSILGIVSIIFSIPFYIIVRLLYTTDRLDKFYQQNFIFAFSAIFLVLPALTIGFAIAALKQKDRNKLFAYLEARPKSSRFSGFGSTLHDSPNQE